jgi:hypothetical protein
MEMTMTEYMKYTKTVVMVIAEANGDERDFTVDDIKENLQFPADDLRQFNVIDIREERAF